MSKCRQPSKYTVRLLKYSEWWSIDFWAFVAFDHSIRLPVEFERQHVTDKKKMKRQSITSHTDLPLPPKGLASDMFLDFLWYQFDWFSSETYSFGHASHHERDIPNADSHVYLHPEKKLSKYRYLITFIFIWENQKYRLNISKNGMLFFVRMHPTNRSILSGRSKHVWQCQNNRST